MNCEKKPACRYNFPLRGVICSKPIRHHEKETQEDSNKVEAMKLDENFREILFKKDLNLTLAELRIPAVRKLNERKKCHIDPASAALIRACNEKFREKYGNVRLLVDGTGEPSELVDRLLGLKERCVSDTVQQTAPHRNGYPAIAAVRDGYTFGFHLLDKMYKAIKLDAKPPSEGDNKRALVPVQNVDALENYRQSKYFGSTENRSNNDGADSTARESEQRARNSLSGDFCQLPLASAETNRPDQNNTNELPHLREMPLKRMICGKEIRRYKPKTETFRPLRVGSGSLDENFLENLLNNKDPNFLSPPRLQTPNIKRLNEKRKKKLFDDASKKLFDNFKKKWAETHDGALLLDTAKRRAQLGGKTTQTQDKAALQPPKVQESFLQNASTTVSDDFMRGFRKFQRLSDEKRTTSVLSSNTNYGKSIAPVQSTCSVQKKVITKYSSPCAAYTGDGDSFFEFEPAQRVRDPPERDSYLQSFLPQSETEAELPFPAMMAYMDFTTEDEDFDRFTTSEVNYIPSDSDEGCRRLTNGR